MRKLYNFVFALKSGVVLLSAAICLVVAAPVSAAGLADEASAQVEQQRIPLSEALRRIGERTGYTFAYNTRDVDLMTQVTDQIPFGSIQQVMDAVLAGTKYMYTVREKHVVITPREQAPVEITVLDADTKEPLVGATITVRESTRNGVSGPDGQVKLPAVPHGSTIVVRYLGYKEGVVKLSPAQTAVAVLLQKDELRMDDIVVTGYQTISKERATGSYSTVDIKNMENKLQPDLKTLLDGQVAGMTTNLKGELEIRGLSTFNAATQPLIVLDGFPYEGTLDQINPANVENITVLKDGVAASIYGSRSANGVIVVTTKSGKKDSFKISYRGSYSYKAKSKIEELLQGSTSDYIDCIIEENIRKPFYSDYAIFDDVRRILGETYFANKANPDWESAKKKIEPYRSIDGFGDLYKYGQRAEQSQSHNVSINGGGQKNFYNVSLNLVENYASTPKDNSQQMRIDVKNSWKPVDAVSFDVFSSFNYNKVSGPVNSWRSLMGMNESSNYPYERLIDEYGNGLEITPRLTKIDRETFAKTDYMYSIEQNPWEDLLRYTKDNRESSFRLGGNVRIKIIDGLTISGGGVWHTSSLKTNKTHQGESFYIRSTVNMMTDKNNPSIKYLPMGDVINEGRSISDNWTARGQIDFNRTFGGKHRVSVLAGAEVRQITSNENTYPTRLGYNPISGNFASTDIYAILNKDYEDSYLSRNGGFPIDIGGIKLSDKRYTSFYGNGSYEFGDRYLVSGSIRLDLTNFFGTNPKYRYKPLWSVGGTWKLSNEAFFDVPVISKLYVRGSYGINGNISLNQGPFLILGSSSFVNDDTNTFPSSILSAPNDQLRWEKTATTNLGLDMGFFRDRLMFTFDYYNRKSTDLLASDQIDPTVGLSSFMRNVGAIRNTGIELTLGGKILTGKFRWNSNVIFSYNKNNVQKYHLTRNNAFAWVEPSGAIAEGYGVGALFSYRFAGLNNEGVSQVYNAAGEKIAYDAAEFEDLVYNGSANAPYSLSFSNTMSWKGFDLSFMFTGKFGGKYRKDGFFGNNPESRYASLRWQKEGDEAWATYPVYNTRLNQYMYNPYMDFYIEKSSYFRLRDLVLSYNFPQSLLKGTKLDAVKVSLQGTNLFTLRHKGMAVDPETLGYPTRPEVFVGLSVTF